MSIAQELEFQLGTNSPGVSIPGPRLNQDSPMVSIRTVNTSYFK